MMVKCRFCDIISGKVEDYILWENERFVVLLNVKPFKPGCSMVIPKKHIDYLFDLDDELYSELFIVAKKMSGALKRATGAKRIGLVLTGFEIPHVHLHLVPLHKSNELFSQKKTYRAKKSELDEMSEKIKKQLAGL
jgi:histidine triad (HIT) family protein